MLTRLSALLCLAAWLTAMSPANANPAVVRTDQVRAELLAHAPQGVAPGQPLWLGLRIEHQPHWHTYWRNPGDSGLPTSLLWSLPAGFAPGEVQWPTPQPLRVGPLMNYGYEGTVLLVVPVEVPAGFSAEQLSVKLSAQWLVCKEVCIPESGDFSLDVPARAATVAHGAAFQAARAMVPRAWPGVSADARVQGNALDVRVTGLPAAWAGRALRLFPETAGVIDNAAVAEGRWSGDVWEARIALSPQRSESPEAMAVVLAADGAEPGVQATMTVAGPWPAPVQAPATLAEGASAAESTGVQAWVAAMAFALLGGALLNLMPCVFPVLCLKVVAVAHHGAGRRQALAGALAYTAGVIASFLALATVLLVLRAGGALLGWGFQLQSPLFVSALAVLFSLIGLNLAGVFEFTTRWPAALGALRLRHPLADSALTGVLAVAVASPCTAPFMGASLGVAATLPAPQALTVFGTLGLGMALPYLAVCAWPALGRSLPRPGPWMRGFKHLMAFPMFATVVWLLWVLGQQSGVDAVTALLGTLVALAFAVWTLSQADLKGVARNVAAAASLAALAAVVAWAWPTLRATDADGAPSASEADALWQPWSEQRVRASLAQGRPVFVDFTAAWCVTCQFNKRTVLSDGALLADFKTQRVALLRADWTRRDAAITQALAAMGRNGVPVYALYAPGTPEPRLLSELLSVAEVRNALAALR